MTRTLFVGIIIWISAIEAPPARAHGTLVQICGQWVADSVVIHATCEHGYRMVLLIDPSTGREDYLPCGECRHNPEIMRDDADGQGRR